MSEKRPHTIRLHDDEIRTLISGVGREIGNLDEDINQRTQEGSSPDFLQPFYNIRRNKEQLKQRLERLLPKEKKRR